MKTQSQDLFDSIAKTIWFHSHYTSSNLHKDRNRLTDHPYAIVVESDRIDDATKWLRMHAISSWMFLDAFIGICFLNGRLDYDRIICFESEDDALLLKLNCL